MAPAGPYSTERLTTRQVTWGRASRAGLSITIGALFMVISAPIWVHLNWIALEHFDGSLTTTFRVLVSKGLITFVQQYSPQPSYQAALGYAAWLVLQSVLYSYLPGLKCLGQRTPGGHQLSYTTNGLTAWYITHIAFLAGALLGLLDPAIIAKHWQGLLVVANAYGFVLATFAQLKGYWYPSYREDCKISGERRSCVELNPRLGKQYDIKFFHNGRPGIVAWTLINFSWAAYQRERIGYVTNSMLVVIALQTIYVVDFFINENWYTRTIDISHDHFGFMLAWGDTTFLPTTYTLQAQYLARNPTHLTSLQTIAILTTGLTAYAIFRSANHQRDHVRTHNGAVHLWGRPATFIRTTYFTSDGQKHDTILLTSGWWGVVRHANYFADLLFAATMCATCGVTHVLPWTYFFFMGVLLCHRCGRDERRCQRKYGEFWREYCQRVPWRLVPGVY